MKPPQTGALMCAFFMASAISIFAQGNIVPTTAPNVPIMKSLDQIEARTPISSVPATISTSGSYYLTKNLTIPTGNAITINANDVTLDLNGFTISSTQNPAAGGSGIALSSGAVKNIAIFNGAISSGVTVSGGNYSGTGFGYGIATFSAQQTTARVSSVSVSGCLVHGIYLGTNSTVVESCTVDTVGGNGITATSVSHSAALNCGGLAILGNSVSDSFGTTASGGGSGYGIYAATATNCYGSASGTGSGIYATVATNCWGDNLGSSSAGHGVQGGEINNCRGTTAGGSGVNGITGDTANNSYGYASGNGGGVLVANANGCYGVAAGSGHGINALFAASNCYGKSSSGNGITCREASNCSGDSTSQNGILAECVSNSVGHSESSYGIQAYSAAIGCSGHSNSGTGISALTAAFCYSFTSTGSSLSAKIANGCVVDGFGTSSIQYKYNMP